MFVEFFPFIVLGFGLGLLHALDADHIMAVSVLNSQKPGVRKALFHSAYWALGHGGVLLACGLLLFGVGISIPSGLQYAAEVSVGVLLIVLGVLCFRQFKKENIKLEHHRHGDVEHTHWRSADHGKGNQHAHKPVLIGVLHGLAGSAPALALIPAVTQGQLSIAMLYLALFSLGVMLSMLTFGLGFSQIQRFLSQRYQTVFRASRYLMASVSIALGGFWLVSAL